MSKEQYFTLDDNPESEKHESIWFWDEVSGREVFASDLRAFLDFRMQIEMMNDGQNECSFLELSRQAKELEVTFKSCLNVLGKKKFDISAEMRKIVKKTKAFYINVHPNTGDIIVTLDEPAFPDAIRVVPEEEQNDR